MTALKHSCAKPKRLPQMSYGFGAHQREDDVVILLTLKPVHRRYLQKNMPGFYLFILTFKLCYSYLPKGG